MLLYELRKIFGARNVLIVIIALLLINFLLVYFSASYNERIPLDVSAKVEELYFSSREDYQAEYFRVCDEYWQARDNGIEYSSYNYDTSGNISDFSLFYSINEKFGYYEEYDERISSVLNEAEKRKAEIKRQGLSENSFSYKYQDEVIDIYSEHAGILNCETVSVVGWEEYLLYDEVNIITMVCIVLVGVHLINVESSLGTLTIIRTTRFGRRTTQAAKFCAGVLVSVLLTLLFTLSTLLAFGVKYGFSSPFVPVQLIEEFSLTPWHFNILQTVLLAFAFKCLVSVFVISISMFVAAFADHVTSYILITAFLAANYGIYLVPDSDQARHLNVFSVSSANIITRYRAIPLFENCVDIVAVILVCYIGSAFLLAVLAIITEGRAKLNLYRHIVSLITKLKKILPQKIVKISRPKNSSIKLFSIFSFELYKHRLTLAVIAVIILLKLVVSYADVSSNEFSSNELLYKEYMETLYGEVTDEKMALLAEEQNKMLTVILKENSMRISYELGEVSEEEYREYTKEFIYYNTRYKVFQNVCSKAEYLSDLKNNGGVNAMFFYDSGFYRLYNKDVDALLNVAIIILCGSIFAPEYKKTSSSGGMCAIVRLTKRGRNNLYRSKIIIASVGAFALYMFFFVVDIICVILKYDIDVFDFKVWNSSITNLEKYSRLDSSMSLLQYLVAILFLGALGTVFISIVCFSISNICEKTFFAYSSVLIITLIPYAVYLGGMDKMAMFSILFLQTPDLFILSPEMKAVLIYSVYLACVFTSACLSRKKWLKT